MLQHACRLSTLVKLELSSLCSSRKYLYPPQGRLMEIARGRGVSKAQFCKGKYGTNTEFPEGWGFKLKKKTFHGRGLDIFWNNTLCNSHL